MISKENKIDDLVNSKSLGNTATNKTIKSQNEMEEELKKLKDDLYTIKIYEDRYKIEKNKREKTSIDNHITKLKEKLISDFNLVEFDKGINLESYNTNLFIHDVESIIFKLEN
jgi:hypothetical protein